MDTVNINVSGKKFTIRKSVLLRFPQTKLGRLTEKWPEYNPEENEYFFDRNPKVMLSIFDLYRTGELHLPKNVCSFTVKTELDFWQIDESLISECCWKMYTTTLKAKAVIDVIEKSLNEHPFVNREELSTRQHLWMTMEFPQHSIVSKIWFTIYMLFVSMVVIIACLYTIPQLREPLRKEDSHLASGSILDMLLKSEMKGTIYRLDLACLVFFTVELLTKFTICPEKKRFFSFGLNNLDVTLTLIMWTAVVLDHIPIVEHVHIAHTVLRAMFCLNVLRIFHLGKSSNVMKLLIFTLKASLSAFGLLLVTLTMAVIIYATLAYFAEVATKADTFSNIPIAIWWTVVTMTTVGYGDICPQSWAGYVVGVICSLSGILLIAMPIAIIASNFDAFYSNMPAAEQRIRRKRLKESEDERLKLSYNSGAGPQTLPLKTDQYYQPTYVPTDDEL
ncbi:potassium voltage-gated channel subfamily C member 3-like [Haliotis rufescens]|uniref:potassium voltage-gated channel subfamily C member 3-like n=1 Tax=Haliotis rufescens TaxID=6454 RepID=UPI00201FAD5D|nr:potassium voltage-gated channel subfamily C member 3-like [Haliotis rufescens]XP_048251962.1 potassium voltage-gated channel subfamily C member 3-like [Haliotis rufescens]